MRWWAGDGLGRMYALDERMRMGMASVSILRFLKLGEVRSI